MRTCIFILKAKGLENEREREKESKKATQVLETYFVCCFARLLLLLLSKSVYSHAHTHAHTHFYAS